MSTHPDSDSSDSDGTDDQQVGEVPTDEIELWVEVPYEVPGEVRQVNAVADHTESDRRVRRQVVYDRANKRVLETEVGLLDGREVWRRRYDTVRWLSNNLVYHPGLQEAIKVREYTQLAGHDEPGYRLGCGFREAHREAHGISIEPW